MNKFINYLKLFNRYSTITPNYYLGRWKLNDNINRKIDLANIDNCGDILCGIPISKELKEKIKEFDKEWDKNTVISNNNIESIVYDYNKIWKKNITVKDYKDNFSK